MFPSNHTGFDVTNIVNRDFWNKAIVISTTTNSNFAISYTVATICSVKTRFILPTLETSNQSVEECKHFVADLIIKEVFL